MKTCFLILIFNLILITYSYHNFPKIISRRNGKVRLSKETLELSNSPEDMVQLFFSESSKANIDIANKNELIQHTNLIGRNLLEGMKRPYGKDEAWRHTNLRKIFSHLYRKTLFSSSIYKTITIDHLIDDSCKNSCMVFVDGKFVPQLSRLDKIPSDIVVSSLLEHSSNSINDMLNYIPDIDELSRNSFGSDTLTALNLAQLEDVACVVVPNGIDVDIPIQILFCSSSSGVKDDNQHNNIANTATANSDITTALASYPRLLISVGEGSSLKLKQSMVTIFNTNEANSMHDNNEIVIGNPSFVNSNTRILLGENSRLVHTYVQDLSSTSRHMEVISSEVSGNSSYEVCVLQTGASIGRMNIHVNLTATEANCTLNGVSLAGDRQSLDIHSNIVHDAPAANSRQQQRNVIADRGEAIFKGRIRIPKHAQLTDSDQLCRSIMLGQRARVIAMPTLEITADNVVCSHGASVTDLDENSMFYLAARGIDRQEARKLLLRGFVFDLLQDHVMDNKAVRKVVSKLELMYPKLEGIPTDSAQKFTSM